MRKSLLLTLGVLSLLLLFFGSPAHSIPAFSSQTGMTCSACHAGYPRLNDFGVRFRQNGYQLPGEVRSALKSPSLVSAHVRIAGSTLKFAGGPTTKQVQIDHAEFVSGGAVSRNVGYYMGFAPQLNDSQNVMGQPARLGNASVLFADLGSRWLNVRAGRFEPAYVAFSTDREPPATDYLVYGYAFPGEPDSAGVEISGYGSNGIRYYAGQVSANGDDPGTGCRGAYFRVAKVVGSGEGESRGQRFGVTKFIGHHSWSADQVPGVTTNSDPSAQRLMFDASLNRGLWNLGVLYATGEDGGAAWGKSSDVNFTGGLARLIYSASPTHQFFARCERLNSDLGKTVQWSFGGRYYPMPRMALQLELGRISQEFPAAAASDSANLFVLSRVEYIY